MWTTISLYVNVSAGAFMYTFRVLPSQQNIVSMIALQLLQIE